MGEPGPNVKISKPHSKALELALKALPSQLDLAHYYISVLILVAWVELRKEKALCLCTISPEILKLKSMHSHSCLSFPGIGFSLWCSSSRWQQSLLPKNGNLVSSGFASVCVSLHGMHPSSSSGSKLTVPDSNLTK